MEILKQFEFRKAELTEQDFEIYLQIKSDKDAIAYSGFNSAPDAKVFRKVYERILNSENEYLYYLCDAHANNKVAGTFHFSRKDNVTAEGLGYNVFPEYRGKGLGWVMMHKINNLCQSMGFLHRLSYVAETNIASIKNLEKSGAYYTGEYDMRDLPALGKQVKYLHYITDLF